MVVTGMVLFLGVVHGEAGHEHIRDGLHGYVVFRPYVYVVVVIALCFFCAASRYSGGCVLVIRGWACVGAVMVG